MSYFSQFPVIPYDALGDGEAKIVTNILKRVVARSQVSEQTTMFDTYTVKDGETPEMIAHRLYDDINLHWVVLLFNNVKDRYHDWPMSNLQFEAYLKDKYDNVNGVHHYEITETSGHQTTKIDVGTNNSIYPSADSISNYDFEATRQDQLRQIKLLYPQYVDRFVKEFHEKIKETVI